jgi:hypothetical protein
MRPRPPDSTTPPAGAARLAGAFLLLLFISLPGAARAADAPCPPSTILCLGGDPNNFDPASGTTTAPTFHGLCEGVILNTAGADFDVPAGTFDIFVAEGGDIDLALRDAFTVTGPATGTPVALHLRLRFHGYENWAGGCCPDSQVRVAVLPLEPQAGDPAPVWTFGKSGFPYQLYNFADSLDFTLQRTAGAPVGIEIHALSHLTGASSMNLIGSFSFLDLQPGWTVTSCKGYRAEQPVPAVRTSWGSLKATYR